MARILTVTANPLLNYITGSTISSGQINRVTDLTAQAEGKGINVARVLKAHGHEVTCCGFAGGASGQALSRLVEGLGITPAFTATQADLRIGFMDGGQPQPTTILGHGFPVSAAEAAACTATVQSLAAHHDLIIISGSVPCPELGPFYAQMLEALHPSQIPCWMDSYGPAAEAALLCQHPPALVKPNAEEFAASSAWQRAGECHLSDGAAGVQVSGPHGSFAVSSATVEQRNPIGSGDCYLAGLAHARLHQWPEEHCLRYAAAAGAANAARKDVAMIGPDDISALTSAVTISGSTP